MLFLCYSPRTAFCSHHFYSLPLFSPFRVTSPFSLSLFVWSVRSRDDSAAAAPLLIYPPPTTTTSLRSDSSDPSPYRRRTTSPYLRQPISALLFQLLPNHHHPSLPHSLPPHLHAITGNLLEISGRMLGCRRMSYCCVTVRQCQLR